MEAFEVHVCCPLLKIYIYYNYVCLCALVVLPICICLIHENSVLLCSLVVNFGHTEIR